jgi:hypothetical protein
MIERFLSHGSISSHHQADCRFAAASESCSGRQVSRGGRRFAADAPAAAGLSAQGSRTQLPARGGVLLEAWRPRTSAITCVVLLLVLLCCFRGVAGDGAGAGAVTRSRTGGLSVTEEQLRELCRRDASCSTRWYLPREQPGPTDNRSFHYLMDLWLHSDLNISNLLEAPSESSASSTEWWWLRLMRTAVFCPPHRVHVLGVGCRCRIGGPSCDAPNSADFAWQ